MYGLLAEFEHPSDVVKAAQQAYAKGYRRMDGHTPFPIEGLDAAMGITRNEMPSLVFCAGITGTITGAVLEVYAMAIDYPLNIGGRPYISWPIYIPVAYELTILFAALMAVFGMLGLNGFPRPYHPIFNVDQFARASKDRFFLSIEATDPLFDPTTTRDFLNQFHPVGVYDVQP